MSKVQTVDSMNNQCSQNAHLEIFPDWINIVVGKYSGEELTQLVSWQRLQHHVGRGEPARDRIRPFTQESHKSLLVFFMQERYDSRL